MNPEWVPSAANIADLPSRGEYNEYFANFPASIWTDFRLPDFASFMGPLSELMEAFGDVTY